MDVQLLSLCCPNNNYTPSRKNLALTHQKQKLRSNHWMMFLSSDRSSRHVNVCRSVRPSVCLVQSALKLSFFISLPLSCSQKLTRDWWFSGWHSGEHAHQRPCTSESMPTNSYCRTHSILRLVIAVLFSVIITLVPLSFAKDSSPCPMSIFKRT